MYIDNYKYTRQNEQSKNFYSEKNWSKAWFLIQYKVYLYYRRGQKAMDRILDTLPQQFEDSIGITDVEIEETKLSEDTVQDKDILPILPLKNIVTLPTSIVPVIVGRKSSIKAVEEALQRSDKAIFVTAQRHPDTENPSYEDLYEYGTRSTILQMMKMPNGSLKILVEGVSRGKMLEMHEIDNYLSGYIQDLSTIVVDSEVDLEASWRQLKNTYVAYAKLNQKIPQDLMTMARSAQDKDSITDTIAVHANLTFEDRQKILETIDLKRRMIEVSILLKKEMEILQAEQRIKGRIQNQVEKNQREYYLTEQIKAIYKELGREDQMGEINDLRAKIKALKLPEDVAEKAEKELRRLEQMPPLSAEAGVSKHYLDWIISLPWHKESKDSISIKQAEGILNKDHAGLEKIKERIIEFIAAKKYSKELKRAPIVCLVGPPGVGKTSLASSIAKSLGREFVRISLGGVRDEAEIRGHRRTYIGALPGKIIQSMKKAKTVNPVILLDEIDKMSKDLTGDPAAALLEVLDPEQNKNFVDHFLDAEYDLSKVMFITTANMIDTIPLPLYDRMEVIQLSGYTEEEKMHIFKNFLLPRQLKEYGITKKQIRLSDDVISTVISEYTREAGVRQLDRMAGKLMRKCIQEFLKHGKDAIVTIDKKKVQEWLGYPKFKRTDLSTDGKKIGIATGLAWTELGGDVLEIEVAILPGKGNLTLTGQLGEVMQESAQAAYSYVRARAEQLGLAKATFNNKDIHIHMPEGATPKDGPSAGITICSALISALTNIPIRPRLAMTGEITLRGRVLGVGGLKEKILAARQYACDTVMVPKANESDVKEALQEIGGTTLTIHYVSHMDEVLKHALISDPLTVARKKKAAKKTATTKKTAVKAKTKRK